MRALSVICLILAGCSAATLGSGFADQSDAEFGIVFEGHHYFYSPIDMSGDSAEAACIALGPLWHLATISSKAENDFVYGLTDPANQFVWIGLNDKAVEGQYQWLDGEPTTYLNWRFGEPNNDHDEDCAYMQSDGWNDAICSKLDTRSSYVCEHP
jgi:hypothetical protein